MQVTGITISGFRSICGDPVTLSPIRRVNILLGTNCSGKSNVLRALSFANPSRAKVPEGPDIPFRAKPQQFSLTLTLEGPDAVTDAAMKALSLNQLARVFGTTGRADASWNLHNATDSAPDFHEVAVYAKTYKLSNMNRSGPDRGREAKGHLSTRVREEARTPQRVEYISGSPRALTEYEQQKTLLATYDSGINPAPDNLEHARAEERIKSLNDHLAQCIHVGRIYKPNGKDQLYAERFNRLLPMDAHGSGLEHVYSLFNWCLDVGSDRTWVLIEELETHLHPELTQRLLRLLLQQTKSTYFIATHSPSLMVFNDDVSLFRVSMNQNGETQVNSIFSRANAAATLSALGTRPSDVLLSNYVVWVEGPSDRILIRRWLELSAPDLKENTHYSFLVYGGTNLNAYTFNEVDETGMKDTVSALAICRNATVVKDSDRGNDSVNPNCTDRLRKEFEAAGIPLWLTDGRTIEHYLPANVVLKYFSGRLHKQPVVAEAPTLGAEQDFDDWLQVVYGPPTIGKRYYDRNKVEHCIKMAPELDDSCLDQLDLKDKLMSLARLIREANGIGGSV